MGIKKKRVGWDGISRIPNKKYKENYDLIFNTKEGSVINTGNSFISKDYSERNKSIKK